MTKRNREREQDNLSYLFRSNCLYATKDTNELECNRWVVV